MCGSSDGAGKRGLVTVNRVAWNQKSALQQASFSSEWELNSHFSFSLFPYFLSSPFCLIFLCCLFLVAFSWSVYLMLQAVKFVYNSLPLFFCGVCSKSTRAKEQKKRFIKLQRTEETGEEGETEHRIETEDPSEVRWRCTFFVMTASSICCLLLLLTALISFFHHQPSPFTYWAVLPLICPSTGPLIHPPSVGQWQTFNWWESRSN